ncbi:hypothetical protein HDU91_003740, partial [Kappamyces sp. JEL0680]
PIPATLYLTLQELFGPQTAPSLAIAPALLYFFENTLYYIVLQSLSPSDFILISPLRIVFKKGFQVMLVNHTVETLEGYCLAAVMAGCLLTFVSACTRLAYIGAILLVLECILSGLAGVLYDWSFAQKSDSPFAQEGMPDIWLRGIQISCFSIVPAIISLTGIPAIYTGGFFAGYSIWTLFSILLLVSAGVVAPLLQNFQNAFQLQHLAHMLSILFVVVFAPLLVNDSYPQLYFVIPSALAILPALLLCTRPSLVQHFASKQRYERLPIDADEYTGLATDDSDAAANDSVPEQEKPAVAGRSTD